MNRQQSDRQTDITAQRSPSHHIHHSREIHTYIETYIQQIQNIHATRALDRKTERHTHSQTNQTYIHTDRHKTERQTEWTANTDRQTDKHTIQSEQTRKSQNIHNIKTIKNRQP